MREKLFITAMLLALGCLFSACGKSEGSLLPPAETEQPVQEVQQTPAPEKEKFDGRIERIEINQALSYDENGEPIENFAAKKKTTVFARLSETVQPDPETGTQYLEVTRDGELVGRWPPSELSDSMNLCFNIIGDDVYKLIEGEYEFTVCIDGIRESRSAVLTQTRDISVLAVPVSAGFAGTVSAAQGCEDALWHIRSCWPVSEDSWKVTLAETLDFSDRDMRREGNMFALWQELSKSSDEYDMVIGFVSGMMGAGQNVPSYTQGKNTMIISLDAANSEAMVSHVAAHFYGVGDEYDGGAFSAGVNCPPDGVSGVTLESPHAAVTITGTGRENAQDHGLYCSGCVITPDQIAFDSHSFRQMGYAASFMASGGEYSQNYWITADVWNSLFAEFTGEKKQPSGTKYETAFGVRITGALCAVGSFEAERMSALPDTPITPVSASEGAPYSVVFEDAEGNIIAQTYLDPSFFILSDPVGESGYTLLDVSVAVPDGAALLRLYGPKLTEDEEGNEVYVTDCIWKYEISENVPTASVTNIGENKEFSGTIWVEWSGSDEDGDSLYYTVSFVCDDGTEIGVYAGTGNTCPVDLGQLPLASGARIRIRCTDGFNAVVSDSAAFVSLG